MSSVTLPRHQRRRLPALPHLLAAQPAALPCYLFFLFSFLSFSWETDDLKNPLPDKFKNRSLYINLECINGSVIHIVSIHGPNHGKKIGIEIKNFMVLK